MTEASKGKIDATGLRLVTSGLGEAIRAELAGQLNELPLERFCTRGGWPLDVAISRVEIKHEDADLLEALLYVSFTETGAACCSGDNFEHERFSELTIEIDKRDWSCTWPAAD